MMHSSTYLNRLRRLLILGAVVAGLTASAAGARIDPGVDGGLRWQWEHEMHSPGTAAGQVGGLRWQWEHQMHSPGTASQNPTPADATRTAQIARHFQHEDAIYGVQMPPVPRYYGSRAPYAPTTGHEQPLPRYYGTTSPYAAQEPSAQAVSTGNSNSFDWNDYAIGIATGLGVALVLAAALLVGRHQRHRPQPA